MNDRQLRMIKKAFMPLTDQAMAAQGGALMPPPGAMPPQEAPMTAVDPNIGMPMDPNMIAAQGAPMTPQGGMPPADPATGMPMDPNMMAQGGMPPQGGAPVSTGDMVIDMLLEMGAMIVDPNGQPVPPEMIAQMVQEMNAQTGGMPPQGGALEGVPAGDHNGDATLETLAQLDKNVAVMLDKLDSLRSIVDDLRGAGESSNKPKEDSAEADANAMDAELQALLAEQAMAGQQAVPVEMPVDAMPMTTSIDPQQAEQLSLMQAMQGGY